MLMDDDEDFHELFRTHLILPHVHNDFLAQYSKERAGGHLFAFQKTNGGIRPILCGWIFRRCYASLMSEAYRKEATRHFTESVPNFIQCAGGLRDGSTICAQLLRTFDSEPATVNGTLQALMEIDLVNAFNETSRQAAFDVLAGRASREYDKVKSNGSTPFLHLAAFVTFSDISLQCMILPVPLDMLALMDKCIISKAHPADNKGILSR